MGCLLSGDWLFCWLCHYSPVRNAIRQANDARPFSHTQDHFHISFKSNVIYIAVTNYTTLITVYKAIAKPKIPNAPDIVEMGAFAPVIVPAEPVIARGITGAE